ncbi:membrane protein [Kaistia sp. 32K]|uniref:OpgC family protein n=1 Tax=Kaistia sp. 32K TaxID=2795690 RepID=UPI0019150B14|nr:OpgC domain-containing protein [Kaistia sp. 32K]BCP55094.1 membrane protein [Kaistia sp. 32K]
MYRAFPNPMPRDYRIDFFRGLALISIFVNHIPGNLYSNFTHRNFGLSDAAEIFVLLAGVSAALAYFPRFASGQAVASTGLVGKRIGTLYIAHLAAMAAGFAIYAAASISLDAPGLMLPDERHWLVEQPVQALAGIGMLTYQTGNFNILPMYMVMMAMLPLMMLLARVHLGLVLGASFALWLVTNIFRLTIPNFPGDGGWYFNPLAWQFLFTIGFVGGVLLRRGERLPFSRAVYWFALFYLVAAAGLVYGGLWGTFPRLPEWFWLSGFNKTWVGVFRLLHVLSLAYVVIFSPLPGILKRWLDEGNWIVRLGRHTLPVFWLGTLLSVAGHIVRENVLGLPNDPIFTGYSLVADTVLIGAGLAALFALAAYLDWIRPQPKRRPAAETAPSGANSSGMVAAE